MKKFRSASSPIAFAKIFRTVGYEACRIIILSKIIPVMIHIILVARSSRSTITIVYDWSQFLLILCESVGSGSGVVFRCTRCHTGTATCIAFVAGGKKIVPGR